MNRFEARAQEERKAHLRSSMTLWTGGLVLVAVAFAIVGLRSGSPPQFWSKAAIALAVLLLILRQLNRRLKGRMPKAAQPDPKSRLNLD
jgi:apolipoprotein N-acyltransferase